MRLKNLLQWGNSKWYETSNNIFLSKAPKKKLRTHCSVSSLRQISPPADGTLHDESAVHLDELDRRPLRQAERLDRLDLARGEDQEVPHCLVLGVDENTEAAQAEEADLRDEWVLSLAFREKPSWDHCHFFYMNSFSPGSFHLIQLLLNEHILHEVERLVCEDSMKELMLNMVNAQATELSDSSFIDSLGTIKASRKVERTRFQYFSFLSSFFRAGFSEHPQLVPRAIGSEFDPAIRSEWATGLPRSVRLTRDGKEIYFFVEIRLLILLQNPDSTITGRVATQESSSKLREI